MTLNAHFWAEYFARIYIPALDAMLGALETRFLANFRLTDIKHEADAATDEAWKRFMSLAGTGDRDPGDFADAAEEAG
jgi:hypothetical protein